MPSPSREGPELGRARLEDNAFGRVLVEIDVLTRDQLTRALGVQGEKAAKGERVRLSRILFDLNLAYPKSLQEALNEHVRGTLVCPSCGHLFRSSRIAGDHRCVACEANFAVVDVKSVGSEDPTPPARPKSLGTPTPKTSTFTPFPGRPSSTPGGPRIPVSVPEAGGRAFGRYDLISEVSRGGMGVVYRANDRIRNRQVAVKILLSGSSASDEELARFRREANAASRLSHPNIVRVLESGVEEGFPYLVMEFVEGRSLSEVLFEEAILPVQRAVEVLRDIGRAISVAHEQGILHRDIKPGNILIDPTGRARLTDFGLAKHLGQDTHLTRTGTSLGTPAYMSPEQASGEANEVDERCDIYSLGAVLYHMLVGQPPFDAESTVQLLFKVVGENAKSPRLLNSEIPEAIEAICMKAIEKEPVARYQHAREMVEDVNRFLDGAPTIARPMRVTDRARRWLRKHRAQIIASLISAAAFAALGGWLALRFLK
ncbi:MAG: serine/threonine-protein kinase [Planctomycetota bacterium]